MAAAIEVSNLVYTYADDMPFHQDVSFGIEEGEKVALVGANGAGKSTLLYQLNGIFQGKGLVRIQGLELNQHTLNHIRALVGLVFEIPDDQLFSPTVYDDVAFGPRYQNLPRDVVDQRVKQALAQVQMEKYARQAPLHLSHGEKKRAAIATVLSMQPSILLLDEPTNGLDRRSRRLLMALLHELPQTMLIATHDLEMALQITSRTLLMDGGRIVADGKTDEILRNEDLLLAHGL
jgi:cobalt/nickel transport system ATP-binding protein